MFVKIINNEVDQYPYTIDDLRRDNPNTAFPNIISSETLSTYGVYLVTIENKPEAPIGQIAEKNKKPNFKNNSWVVEWTLRDMTDIEISKLSSDLRNQRNRLLSASDWTQVADSPVDQYGWATYRQELRDIPQQEEFPFNVTWPTEPNNQGNE